MSVLVLGEFYVCPHCRKNLLMDAKLIEQRRSKGLLICPVCDMEIEPEKLKKSKVNVGAPRGQRFVK